MSPADFANLEPTAVSPATTPTSPVNKKGASLPSTANVQEADGQSLRHHTAGGHGAGPKRQFGLLSIIGLAYAILNSWTAMATSLAVALPSGGPSAVIWGILVSLLGNLAMAASLAEICHTWPVSGGQYHWSSLLAPPRYASTIAFIAGWFSVAGYWALTATASSLAGALITGAYAISHPEYEPERYQTFIVYVVYALIAMFLNVWGSRLLPSLNKAAIIWSLLGAIVICIVCLSVASPNYQSGKFVFSQFINTTGWPNGVAWILGLLQSSFGLTGYDAVSHMVEEMPRPHINAPRAMVAAVLIGASSSFIFLIILLFCIRDVTAVIESTAGALIASMQQATGSNTGAICLAVFPIISMAFTAQGILCASSRMTHAFARDNGLPFSPFFARTNRKTGVPDNAVYLTTALVIIFGLVYLGSSSALNAILSSSVVFLNVSYSIPIALVLFRGRHLLHPPGFPAPTLSMGPVLGRLANIVGLLFTVLTTVFFLFPPELPATGSNMNYAVAVMFAVLLVATIHWIVNARRTYTGPKDIDYLLELAREAREEKVYPDELALGDGQSGIDRKGGGRVV